MAKDVSLILVYGLGMVKKLTKDFGRLLTAMVTPLNKDMSVDYSTAAKLARFLVESGSDGLVVCGTTGESPTLSQEEKLELFRVVLQEVGEKAAVVAGTGGNNTASSIALTQEAEKIGVHGVLLVCPYYNKPSQEGLYRHFEAIARSTQLPVMLYNIPGRTGVNMLPATVARLAQISNVVALKEASGNMEQVNALCQLPLPEGFSLYSGDDAMLLPMMSLGAKGVVSVASHIAGPTIKKMIEAFAAGDTALAKQLQIQLLPLFKGMFIATNPVPLKAALNMMGWPVGPPRLPLVEATEEEKVYLKELLTKFHLL